MSREITTNSGISSRAFETIPKAFISYATDDLMIADHVTEYLRKNHLDVWMDRERLIVGTADWEAALREAVTECVAVVLIATPASRKSQYVQSELLIAESLGLPVYPLWAEGENWIDSISVSRSRSQHRDIRGSAFEAGVTELVEAFNGAGYTLPLHFLYRSFHQLIPDGCDAPKGTTCTGWAAGHTVYEKHIPQDYMVVHRQLWFEEQERSTNYDAILIRPSGYRMAAHLLDDLYLNYLHDSFRPLTYGQSWVLRTRDNIVAVDPSTLQNGQIRAAEGLAKKMMDVPERYNFSSGERYVIDERLPQNLIIVAATDPFVTKTLIRHPKGVGRTLREMLEPKPIEDIELTDYPYVAVVSPSYDLKWDYEPGVTLVQVRDCPSWVKERFNY